MNLISKSVVVLQRTPTKPHKWFKSPFWQLYCRCKDIAPGSGCNLLNQSPQGTWVSFLCTYIFHNSSLETRSKTVLLLLWYHKRFCLAFSCFLHRPLKRCDLRRQDTGDNVSSEHFYVVYWPWDKRSLHGHSESVDRLARSECVIKNSYSNLSSMYALALCWSATNQLVEHWAVLCIGAVPGIETWAVLIQPFW